MGNLFAIDYYPPYAIAEQEEDLLTNFDDLKKQFFDPHTDGTWANHDGDQINKFYQFLEAAASNKPYVLLQKNGYVRGFSLIPGDTLKLNLAKLGSIMQTWDERQESGLLTNSKGRKLKTLMNLYKE